VSEATNGTGATMGTGTGTALSSAAIREALAGVTVRGSMDGTFASICSDVLVLPDNQVVVQVPSGAAPFLTEQLIENVSEALASAGAADWALEAGLDRRMPRVAAKPDDDIIEEALRDVVDPELGVNVYDLGLVYDRNVDDKEFELTLDMTLTSAACPLTPDIEDQVWDAMKGLVNGITINWVWMPAWDLHMITEEGRDELRAAGFNI
jgi:metal-sulfur cluster biosynthetic enzyme